MALLAYREKGICSGASESAHIFPSKTSSLISLIIRIRGVRLRMEILIRKSHCLTQMGNGGADCSHSIRSNDVVFFLPLPRGFTHSDSFAGLTFYATWYLQRCFKTSTPGSSSSRNIACRLYSITPLQRCNTQRKMAQYTINYCNNCCNTGNSFYGYSVADDRSQILAWLSPLEPRVRHREIQERRVDNVGDWLIQTEEFRRWCGLGRESEGNNPVLFCYGDPGVGKTFIR